MKAYPPFLLLAGVISQSAIALVLPFSYTIGLLGRGLGVVLMLLALASIIMMARRFKKMQTTILPDGQPSHLMQTGPFAYSRNPIYVAMVVLLIGSGIATGRLLSLLVVPIFVFLVQTIWIREEEKNLRAVFGEVYRDYQLRVRRWL